MPTNDPFTTPGLPPLCYARHPGTGATVLIVRGQAGYHPVQTFLTPGQLNAALVEPPTPAQVQAMLVGSMYGWPSCCSPPTRSVRRTSPRQACRCSWTAACGASSRPAPG